VKFVQLVSYFGSGVVMALPDLSVCASFATKKPEKSPFVRAFGAGFLVAAAALTLAGCSEDGKLPRDSRHYVPINPELQALMNEKGMTTHAPILIRAYKKESELEVWKQVASGEYKLLKTYPMCRWSGQLGPKTNEGDRQVPEGFYAITPAQMNPNSSFYLSFNVGYPNAYDRAYGRTGGQIMVHGACSSRGCYSMTDAQIAEIYALTREAFGGGQKAVHMQSLPFRFTSQNMARYRLDDNMPFWKNLKEGADHFDVTKREPQVAVCSKRYVFNASAPDGSRLEASSPCPTLKQDESIVAAVSQKAKEDEVKVAELVSVGTKPVKRIYPDGDQHPSFRSTIYAQAGNADNPRNATIVPSSPSRVADVSQPEALAAGAVEVPAEQAKGLTRTALLAKAEQVRLVEMRALAQSEPVATTPAKATPAKVAPSPAASSTQGTSVTAMAPAEKPGANEPAFYRNWLGALGGLTALATGSSGDEEPKAVEAPLPPKVRR
jgi:murein L,D-transpeptidase YafK